MNVAALLGTILGLLVFPVAGLVLLIIGIRKRAASKRPLANHPPGYPPNYPPQPGYPPNYPPQPGYPPPGQPGYAEYPSAGGYQPPAPQPPRPKSAGTAFIVVGIVLLMLGALGLIGAVVENSEKSVAIGDCFTNVIVSGDSNWVSRSCSDPDAVLQYAANADSSGNCPDGKRDDSAYLSTEHDGVRMCFAPNLLEGHCYTSTDDDKTVAPADCSAANAIKVLKRIDGGSDTSACPTGTNAITYTQPKRIYCAEHTEGG